MLVKHKHFSIYFIYGNEERVSDLVFSALKTTSDQVIQPSPKLKILYCFNLLEPIPPNLNYSLLTPPAYLTPYIDFPLLFSAACNILNHFLIFVQFSFSFILSSLLLSLLCQICCNVMKAPKLMTRWQLRGLNSY